MSRAIPQVPVGRRLRPCIGHLIEAPVGETGADACHQVGPQRHLRTVEGRLLDETLGAVAGVSGKHLVGLVGGIAEEVALEDCHRTLEPVADELLIGIEHGIKLLTESEGGMGEAHNDVVLADGSGRKLGNSDFGMV